MLSGCCMATKKKQLTPSAATETEWFTTCFTLIPGGYNLFMHHVRWHHSQKFTVRLLINLGINRLRQFLIPKIEGSLY